MANTLAALADIGNLIADTHALTLNGKIPDEDRKILDEERLGLLGALFGQQTPFCLTSCTILERAENHLIFSGTFNHLLSWEDSVIVEMALVDLAASDKTNERHCVFRINKIPEDSVYSFGDRFLRSGTSLTPLASTSARSLKDYIRNLSFSEKVMVFSSADYSAVSPTINSRLDALMTLDPAFQVKAGVNFLVNLPES